MILLHGSWLAPSKDHPAAEFALWAERLPKRRVAGRASAGVGKPTDRPLRHPYALGEKDLDALVPGKRPTVTWASGSGRRTFDVLAWLPSQGDRPLPSRTSLDSGEKSSAPALALWRLPAFVFDATEAVRLVLTLAAQGDSPEVSLGDDLRFWAAAARFALALAHRQRFLPVVEQEGESYLARWRPLLDDEAEVRDFAHLAAAMPPACRALAWEPHPYGRTRAVEPPPRPEQAAGPGRLLHSFISAVVDQVG